MPEPANLGAPGGRPVIRSSCLSCGALCAVGESYCGRHRPRRRSAKLRGGGATIGRFRRECFALSGGQCEAVTDGVRCDVRDPQRLEAHHVRAVTEGGANDAVTNGLLLCKHHHALLEARRLNEVA